MTLITLIFVLSSIRSGWTEVQPGDLITKDNQGQAEALLIPSTWWMVERGMPMPIIATKKVAWPREYREATAQYAKQVKLAADGQSLSNYVAGCPFPTIDLNDPLAGFRVMWNHEYSPHGTDNLGTNVLGELVNRKGRIERTYELSWQRLRWMGRLYLDPKPIIPHVPPLLHTNLYGPYLLPHELKGVLGLDFRYLSPNVPDDTYTYFPERRQVRRLSMADRGGPLAGVLGTDYDIDSFWGFDSKMSYWSFRVLEEKDILAVMHSGKYGDRSAWCAPRNGTQGILAALPCVSWEKRRVWVIEATPTGYNGRYAYSKRILYIDQDVFFPLIAEIYDQRGEL